MLPIDNNKPINKPKNANESKEPSSPLENELGTGKYDGQKSKTAPQPRHNEDSKDELTDQSDDAATGQEKSVDDKPETDIDYDMLFMA